MTFEEPWTWLALLLLGAYHGINPGMGWLFAVALGMQQKSRWAVGRSLFPIALGHGLAIGIVAIAAGFLQTLLPITYFKIPTALVLLVLGLYRFMRNRHPRWVGMQVGFRDLTLWSFLMASAHGAGLMVLPLLLKTGPSEPLNPSLHEMHHLHGTALAGSFGGLLATGVHTCGYLLVTGLVALLVYEKLGLALLRKAWFNLDFVWPIALMATGCFTLLL